MQLTKDTPGVLQVLDTGSRVYGTPREDSDFDVVVLCSAPLFMKLSRENAQGNDEYEGSGGVSLRSGSTNYIVTASQDLYAAWVRGTARLLAEAPVTRERAIEVMKQEREQVLEFTP